MALRAEQMVNAALKERKNSSPGQILTTGSNNQKDDFSTPDFSDHKLENGSSLTMFQAVLTEKENLKEHAKAQAEVKNDKIREVRQEPEGQLADSTVIEEPQKPVVGHHHR